VIIGVPKEIKSDENRVSLPPDKVEVLVSDGHKVLVESGAGQGSRFSDDSYLYGAGATLVSDPAEIYGTAELIVKVKEPQPNEFDLMQEGQTIFTYLHPAAELDLLDCILKKNVTGIAYETVEDDKGRLGLLHPMSEIAGRLVSQVSARLLTNIESGVGKLLSGVPGSGNCSAFIIGGGTVGFNAATALMGAGADVTVADINLDRIREIDTLTNGHIKTVYPTPAALAEKIQRSEVVVGAVLVPGAKAPKLVNRNIDNDPSRHHIFNHIATD
jgi:alanine dehydrogenase